MTVLTAFVLAYIGVSMAIGLYASRRVHNSTDFVLAGRSLPIHVTIATVFATWFGSEAVLGIPATFIDEGLSGVVADPFGAGLCLVFVGMFFAVKLYRMKLMTIGDFYRERYGRTVELLVSIAICISYLGWVAAQVVALGMVIDLVTSGAIRFEWGMVIGIGAVMFYTIFGGMFSVAIMDFIQMALILIGLLVVAYLVSGKVDGGTSAVIIHASQAGKLNFWPELSLADILAFSGAFVTLALGSIPQQDVFQRVMSAKNEKVAMRGTVIGGSFYIFFCFIPVFITYAATMIDPALLERHLADGGDTQRILPEYILSNVPMWLQILFFGALLSAIMSTASGTLLAPSAIVAENILKQPLQLSDRALLITLRLCVLTFGLIVLAYGYLSSTAGLTIFDMVENAYLVTLCGAFVPLAFGVYWKRATNEGALLSIVFGVTSWASLEAINIGLTSNEEPLLLVPPQLVGVTMAVVGMVVGSSVLGNTPATPTAKKGR